MNHTLENVRPTHRENGPHLGALAVVALVLTGLGVAAAALLSGGAAVASPFAPSADVLTRYRLHPDATLVLALLQFGAAVPLGIYAATAGVRLQRLGARVPGPMIGFFGGVTAAIMLMISALVGWVISQADVLGDASSAPVVHAFAYLSFATGGVGFVVGMGLLVAGIAVPALVLRLLPRWLAWSGLVLAALAELSFLSLAVTPLQLLLPLGRFGGLIWLTAVGFLLPARRSTSD